MNTMLRAHFLKIIVELYELTPEVLEFDIRLNKHIKRGDLLPELRAQLQEVKEDIDNELKELQQAIDGL